MIAAFVYPFLSFKRSLPFVPWFSSMCSDSSGLPFDLEIT